METRKKGNKMSRYYVYRSGWNTANQPSAYSPHTVQVATVRADSAEQAVERAAKRVTAYNGQYLSARLAETVDAEEAEIDGAVEVND